MDTLFQTDLKKIRQSWRRTKGLTDSLDMDHDEVLLQNIDVDYVVYDELEQADYIKYFDRELPTSMSFSWKSSRTILRIFGSTKEGAAVTAYIHGFYPYFHARLEDVSLGSEMTVAAKVVLEKAILKRLKVITDNEIRIHSLKLVRRTGIYRYQRDPSWFVKIELFIPGDTPKIRGLIENKGLLFLKETGLIRRTYESNVEFVVRFMVDANVPGCGWTGFPARKWVRRPRNLCEASNKDTLEIDVDASHVVCRDIEMGDVLAEYVVLCFDIECKGSGGAFPQPSNPNDSVIHIGNYVKTLGSNPRVLHWNDFCLGSSSPVTTKGASVYTFYKEENLLCAWADFVRAVNPDIIMGYNSIDFDMWYLLERAETLDISQNFSYLGKIKRSKSRLKKQKFSSKAYGTRYSMVANLHGRPQFDVLTVLRRDTATKLRSYTLNDVSKSVLKMQKKDMDYKLIPVYHVGTDDQRRKLADYCLWDSILPKLISEKKLYERTYLELARVCMIPLRFLLTKGQQVRSVAQILKFCKDSSKEADGSDQYIMPYNVAAKRNVAQKIGEVGFKGAIVLSPVKGFYPEDVVPTLDFKSLYPSIIIGKNLGYCTNISKKLILEYGLVLDVDYHIAPNGEAFLAENQREGLVPQILKNLLEVRAKVRAEAKKFDPNSDKAKGYNGRQKGIKVVANSMYGLFGATNGRLPCLEVSSAVTSHGRYLIKFVKAVVEACYLVFHKDHKAYALKYTGDGDDDGDDKAEIAEPRQKRRRKIDPQIPGLGDDLVTVVPPKGWIQGPERMKHALGTTREQRLIDMKAMKRVHEPGEVHLQVIYGDTDSVMVRIIGVNSVRVGIMVGNALCQIVNQYFVLAIKLAFEKVLTNYLLMGKKKYVGLEWTCVKRPDLIHATGIESVRRDNPLFIMRALKKVQKLLLGWAKKRPKELRRPDVAAAIRIVQQFQTAILQNTLPIEQYITSKTYSKREDDYVGPQEHIEVVKKQAKRNPNNPFKLGDRIKYVLVQSHKNAKNFEKAEDPKWVVANNLPLDRTYYIGRLKKTFLRIFTPILAAHLMWKREKGSKLPVTDKEIKKEKDKEKRYNEKNAHPKVARYIFSGKHAQKVVMVTPKSGGIIDYLVPIIPALPSDN